MAQMPQMQQMMQQMTQDGEKPGGNNSKAPSTLAGTAAEGPTAKESQRAHDREERWRGECGRIARGIPRRVAGVLSGNRGAEEMSIAGHIKIAACTLPLLFTAPAMVLAQTTDFQVYRGTQVPPEVERIYEKGLKYLVASQNAEGLFPGQYGNEPGVVGLALMSFPRARRRSEPRAVFEDRSSGASNTSSSNATRRTATSAARCTITASRRWRSRKPTARWRTTASRRR